jgi:beta-phosphoglucomutase-like phosphatase (HAD superfamily)
MQKDTDSSAAASDGEEEVLSKGLIIDLDHVALDGHTALFEALKTVLKTKDVSLSLVQFGKICVSRRLSDFVPELLVAIGKKQLSAEKFANDVGAVYAKSLAKDGAKLTAGLKKLLSAAKKDDFALGAVSGLAEDEAQAIFSELGLEDQGVTLVTTRSGGDAAIDTDTWRRVAATLNVPVAGCIGIAADAASARTVLGAGMNVAVKPAPVTSFQDFSGADVVVDELDAAAITSILAIVGHD